jgi:hypothetical protein
MNQVTLKNTVRSLIRELLTEEAEQQPAPAQPPAQPPAQQRRTAPTQSVSVARGAYGSGGRFKDFVRAANARAKKEPRALMRELGVVRASTGTDLEQIKKILNSAFHSNPTMRQAYGGVTNVTEALNDGNDVAALGVHLAELDKRNGIKFLMHVLAAAKNAGVLNLQGAIEINKGEKAPILLYSL